MPAPTSSHVAPFLITGLMLTGCTGTRSTVGDGAFQKRHLRPGWHVDLGGRGRARTDEREVPMARTEPRSHPYPDRVPSIPVHRVELTTQDNATVSSEPLTLSSSDHFSPPMIGADIQAAVPDTTRSALRQQVEEPSRRWNPWAIPAFVAAAGTVALALVTGTSPILVVLGVIVTIILASIALRKGRKNEWSGKGFAVAAMMIGVLAALITLIALVSGGA